LGEVQPYLDGERAYVPVDPSCAAADVFVTEDKPKAGLMGSDTEK